MSEQELTVADLQLSALDAIMLADADPTRLSPPFSALVAWSLGRDRSAQPIAIESSSTTHPVSLEEFQLLAIELRGVLDGGSPGGPTSLERAWNGDDTSEPGGDFAAVDKAISDLTEQLKRDAEAKPDDLLVAELARFGHVGPDVGHLRARLSRILSSVDDLQANGTRSDRLRQIFTGDLPALPRFPLNRTVTSPTLAPESEVRRWLRAVGSVRPAVGRVTTAGTVAEMIGDTGLSVHVGQAPHADGEPWAATGAPSDGAAARTCTTIITDGPAPELGAEHVALVVDRWSERIPATDQVTGVSFHYDAPSARSPQAILVAVSGTGQPWRLFEVAQMLLDTLQASALRMVQPEDLADLGGVLPTLYTSARLDKWEPAPR